MVWTADDLVTQVRARCRIPDGNAAFSSAEILAIADEEISLSIGPLIRGVRQDYLLRQTNITAVASQSSYRIPSRAQGSTVRSVSWVSGGNEHSMSRIDIEDYYRFTQGGTSSSVRGYVYAFQGEKFFIGPVPSSVVSGDAFRVRFHQRPSTLVLTTDTTKTSSVAAVTDSDTLSVTNLNSTAHAAKVDVVQALPPFDTLIFDETGTGQSYGTPGSIDVSSTTDVAVGDWVCLAGYSPIPQIPDICHPLLVAAVSVRVLESLGDQGALPAAQSKYDMAFRAIQTLIQDRDEGDHPKVVNRNSPLRGGRSF